MVIELHPARLLCDGCLLTRTPCRPESEEFLLSFLMAFNERCSVCRGNRVARLWTFSNSTNDACDMWLAGWWDRYTTDGIRLGVRSTSCPERGLNNRCNSGRTDASVSDWRDTGLPLYSLSCTVAPRGAWFSPSQHHSHSCWEDEPKAKASCSNTDLAKTR